MLEILNCFSKFESNLSYFCCVDKCDLAWKTKNWFFDFEVKSSYLVVIVMCCYFLLDLKVGHFNIIVVDTLTFMHIL